MNISENNSVRLDLKGDCTIYEISDLYIKIRDLVKVSPHVTVDLTEVEKVDASFIQLLVAAQLEAKRNKIKLVFSGVSDTVRSMAESICCQIASTGLDAD